MDDNIKILLQEMIDVLEFHFGSSDCDCNNDDIAKLIIKGGM